MRSKAVIGLVPVTPGVRHAAGAAILLAVALFGLGGPWILGVDPKAQDLAASLAPPSIQAPLGHDLFGRSTIARLAEATGRSVTLSLLAATIALLPGVAAGLMAAWRGGWPERAAVLVTDALLAIPGLLLVLMVAMLADGDPRMLSIGIALPLMVEYFRVARAAARPVLAGDAVQATMRLGFGPAYLLRRHIVPALAPVLATQLVLSSAQAVMSFATLAFVSAGVRPPDADLGQLLVEALPHYREAPWLMAAPVTMVMLIVVGMTLLLPSGRGASR